MSYGRKHALIATIVWAVVFAGLLCLVFSVGVQDFDNPDNHLWRLTAAVIILPGFVLNAWLGWRSQRGRKQGEVDERDDAIGLRASQATLIVVAVAVYFASILLYETHYREGAVPAGWLYLIAYGTVSLLSFVHALASLLFDIRGSAHG